MNKKVLTMAVMAAVCGMAAAPVWAANSGGTVNGDGKFVGDNGAADNRLLIDEDSRQEIISGLGTGNDKVQNNSIEVSNGTISEKIIGGMSEGDGDIDSNSITISGGKMRDAVYGAYTEGSGAVTNNKVIIGGMAETSRDPVAGALSQGAGTVAYNSVTATGGNIYSIFGGGSAEGIAEYNSVTVEGDTIIEDSVGGAAALEGVARHNSVTISGTAEIKGKVFGGKIETSSSGDLIDNSVMISGGSIRGEVYGAYTEGDGAVTNNSVTISGSAVEVDREVFGAYTEGSGIVAYNSVTVSGGTINMLATGGVSMDNVARYNNVTVTGGTIKGSIYGGMSGINAIENKVMISGGNIGGDVFGAESKAESSATGNEVIISGTPTFESAYGTNIYGASTFDGEITGHKVTISGTTVFNFNDPDKNIKIYGGYVDNAGNVTGNSVEINGDMNFTESLEIYGGYGGTGAVTGNSVTISGRPIFAADIVIYGGYSASGGEVSGNILNIKSTGITVSNIKNFDVYNFYLPDTVQAGDVLLTVTGGSSNEQTDLKGSSVNVGITGSAPALKSGDNVTLLHNANGILADETTVYGKMTQGVSLEYDFTTVLQNGDSLVTTIIKSGISDDTKSLVETQAAAVGFINSGADLLVSSGITSMSKVTSAEDNAIFGAMSGGSMRYDTGSHADVKGYNFALGMGKAVANNAGRLTFGPFVEYGYGDYTSYLDNGVRGDGKTKYYGVGVLARQDDKSGVYYEGSLRYGRMDADYASNDLGTAGVHSSYDSSSAYYGAHLGIGKVTGLNDTTKADVYAKLLYTHQNGDSVTLQGEGNGEVYDFDAVDSTRARVGARVSKAYSERGTGYVGLAYEYEFDGEARATVKGFSTPAPSIKGSSGLVELGYILQPQGVNDPTINIGLQGWGGKKQGFTGNVDFVWTF